MNFYKHHIGDYAAATAHLTMVEDGAYRRLIGIYYRDEKPLPLEVPAVQRLAGARDELERAAVSVVLHEFFEQGEDGWHSKRCDREIAAFHELEEVSADRRANEAERQRRHRERRKELFESLRELGIVPPFDTQTSNLETWLSRVRTQPETRTATANQTPDSRLQSKEQAPPSAPASKAKKPKRVSKEKTFTAWLETLADGEDAIPDGHHALEYAAGIGVPSEYLPVAWLAFERKYESSSKTYVDWPAVFRKALEGDWLKVWATNRDGEYYLTQIGKQYQRELAQ